ncbi:MAG: hypothetical protein RIR00_942, partial [Pseudomonadota bacterium]
MKTLLPPANPRFRFREDEIERILYAWSQGQSVLLTGIRRTGKSEVQKAALHRYRQQGQRVGFLDVQNENNLLRFYELLLQTLIACLPHSVSDQLGQALQAVGRLPSQLSSWVRGQIRSINVPELLEIELTAPDEQLRRYWTPLVDEIGAVLAAADPEELPVIGLDELPFMLENLLQAGVVAEELRIMLASLRKLRDAGLRLIIAGSISFENLLTLHQIPHTVLGGLSRQRIPPFSRDEARQFLQERLQGRPALAMLEPVLAQLPDYVPEFLLITSHHLHPCRDPAAVSDLMLQEVLPAIRRSFLQQFDERLTRNYSAVERKIAEQILDHLAKADAEGGRLDGSQLPDGYREVLLKLEYDNFLTEGAEFKWRFSLNLL